MFITDSTVPSRVPARLDMAFANLILASETFMDGELTVNIPTVSSQRHARGRPEEQLCESRILGNDNPPTNLLFSFLRTYSIGVLHFDTVQEFC
jgi:hypothetical protein